MQAPSERSAVDDGIDDMQSRGQLLAEQAARIGDVVGLIDRECQRQRMDHFASVGSGAHPRLRAPRGGCRALPPRDRRPATER